VSPNLNDTPLKINAIAKAIAGIPHPEANAPHIKTFPITTCQQI